MICASVYGWIYGNPEYLTIGWDADRNGCGYSEATIDYPYLYFPQSPSAKDLESINAGEYGDLV